MEIARTARANSTAVVPHRAAAGLALVDSSAAGWSGAGWSGAIIDSLDALLGAPSALGAIQAGERLRSAVARTPHRAPPASWWPDPLCPGLDPMAAYGLIHAFAELRDPAVDQVLAQGMGHPDAGIREHAVWAMARRAPTRESVDALVELVATGGFVSMLAGLTLEGWATTTSAAAQGPIILSRLHRAALGASAPEVRRRLVDLAAVIIGSPDVGVVPDFGTRSAAGPGLRIVQLLLYGHLDAELRDAGAGDGGGLVTLLVSLARALGRRTDVDSVTTIARRRPGDPAGPDTLADQASLERIEFGGDTPLSIGSAWEHWPSIERQLGLVLSRLGRIDALHLRLGDVGSMAAGRIAERLGIPVVFTLAPDPHGVMCAAERGGTLSRDTFAAFDQAQHAWFRARLVTTLATAAERLVMFPRPGGPDEVADLLDLRLDAAQVTVVPEGIDLAQARSARGSALRAARPKVVTDLEARIADGPPDRVGLPLLVSAARLHPIKGLDRLVAAWLSDPRLRDGYNLVIAGGDLRDGMLEERQTLAAIESAGAAAGITGAIPGLCLLGSVPNRDVARLLATAAIGAAPHIGARGVYVCSSAKEEFGLSIVEALAAGLPVVAPDDGGPRTYVHDGRTGVLADTTSVAALAQATLKAASLWDDPERGSLVERQIATMGIDDMAERLVGVYRGVATLEQAVG